MLQNYTASDNTNSTDVCMQRVTGIQLNNLRGVDALVGLAHTLKALWHLQRDFNFMHRDLSGNNVMYDHTTQNVSFIDFGMACIKPANTKVWQSSNSDFYKHVPQSLSIACTNRSLDACILIAHMERNHLFFTTEHANMKLSLQQIINESMNVSAKQFLHEPKKELQFTTLKKDWFPGNELKPWKSGVGGDGWWWWLYNMVEFPMSQWNPETILSRLLIHLPIEEWFSIRRNWTIIFDNSMPNNIEIEMIETGKVGYLLKLHGQNKLRVLFKELDIRDVFANECRKL